MRSTIFVTARRTLGYLADLALHICQQLLRLGQVQPQFGDIAKAIRPADLHEIRAWILTLGISLHQPQKPCHAPIPGPRSGVKIPNSYRHPQFCGGPNRAGPHLTQSGGRASRSATSPHCDPFESGATSTIPRTASCMRKVAACGGRRSQSADRQSLAPGLPARAGRRAASIRPLWCGREQSGHRADPTVARPRRTSKHCWPRVPIRPRLRRRASAPTSWRCSSA